MTTQLADLEAALDKVADGHPSEIRQQAHRDVARMVYNIRLVADRVGTEVRICDIGGGIGFFSIGCALVGMDTIVMDDYQDQVNEKFGNSALDLHRRHGVEVIYRDPVRDGLGLPARSLDVVTTFDSMEHWHASPKRLFGEVIETLRPGGLFILGVPNPVNARKRVAVPLGKGKWSPMSGWYEQPVFRGHVREADVDDLRYIARDMGLRDIEIIGRNWLGYYGARGGLTLAAMPLIDRILRVRPSLCSDLYLIGRAPDLP